MSIAQPNRGVKKEISGIWRDNEEKIGYDRESDLEGENA
jgi:hypothetical protein